MAALGRCIRCLATKTPNLLHPVQGTSFTVTRGAKFKRWVRPRLQELYRRRLEQGPEPERHRSMGLNWNYNAELFAFGKRLGEEFNEETLRMAFTERSYIEKERQKLEELELEGSENVLPISHNETLAQEGEIICTEYIQGYFRHHFARVPEEGISAITNHLMSDQVLDHVGSNLGIKDLILCEDFPVRQETLIRVFKAVIGGLAKDQGKERAGLFVRDFIITQLVGKTVSELWDIKDPMGTLSGILNKQGKELPEPRLIWQTGSETVTAAYVVGVYSNKQMIGKGYGETVTIAEEMAAKDALNRIFGLTLDRKPLTFGDEAIDVKLVQSNASLKELTS